MLRVPSVLLGKIAKEITHFRELMEKGNFTIKMDLKNTHMASPYSPILSSQEGVRDRMYGPLKSLKALLDAYIQFDRDTTLLHFQPVKVSLSVPLQGLSLNIVLFLD